MSDFLDILEHWDRVLTLYLNNLLSNPQWDRFWIFMSDKEVWYPLYALVAVLLVWKLGWKRGLSLVVFAALTIIVADQVSYHVKNALERFRPCYDEWMILNGVRLPAGVGGGRYGFFSGHSSNAFAFVFFVLPCCSRLILGSVKGRGEKVTAAILWTVAVIWAILVAVSRIVLGRHFLGDILVGAIFGILVGYLMSRICLNFVRRIRD